MNCEQFGEDAANFIRCHHQPAKATIADYAETWGLSRGTLRGYLGECNINWDILRARTLHQLANAMLAHSKPMIVSEALGYSHPAVFYRTYRQWTGCSIKDAPQPLQERYL
jgi:AraC-like DNA-binding protein